MPQLRNYKALVDWARRVAEYRKRVLERTKTHETQAHCICCGEEQRKNTAGWSGCICDRRGRGTTREHRERSNQAFAELFGYDPRHPPRPPRPSSQAFWSENQRMWVGIDFAAPGSRDEHYNNTPFTFVPPRT